MIDIGAREWQIAIPLFFTSSLPQMRKLLFVLLAVLTLCACHHNATPTTSETDTFTDYYGRTVVVPQQPARIVSTSPAITEIIFALGGQDLLVGRTQYCDYPPEAQTIENIGGISDLNVEKIASLKPDLVISGSMISQEKFEQLATMNIPAVCVRERPYFNGLYENIAMIGELIGKDEEAERLNMKIAAELQELERATDSSDRPTLYYVVGYGSEGNYTAGSNTFIHDIITMAGATNIAADIDGWSFSIEDLLVKDPDYIMIRKEDSAAFCNMHPYKRLSAVRNGRVIGINSGIIDQQVPRNIEAIQFIRKNISR